MRDNEERIPSFLSKKDMLQKDLDISLQENYIHIGTLRQPLALKNYFFIHRWSSMDTLYALYTDADLQKVHRGFGHPSARETYEVLKGISTGTLQDVMMNELNKISGD